VAPNIDVPARHSLSRNSELYGLRRNQSFKFQLATIRELMAINAFPRTNVSDAGSNPCSMSALASKRQLSRDHSGKATIRPGNESAPKTKPPQPPLAGIAGMDLRLLCVHYLAHDDRQKVNFLFRLR
jgi:hypothetical protein